ncbi:MAG: hypothetical protein LBL56_03325 [Treponema sp.]|jgi:hypothetical protein|nr:hypothetical protein [Treponema sp.]
MDKKLVYSLGGTLLLLTFSLMLAGCKADPKDLAKQSYELGQQAWSAMFDVKKAAELEKKATAIEKKVAKLSASDMAIYTEELARLSGSGLGGLFEAASGALNAVNEAAGALDSASNALDAAQQAADLLKSLGN